MAVLKRIRHRIEYIGFLLVAALIGALPLELASRWSGAGWRAIAPRLKRHRRAIANLTMAFPEKSADEREQIALAMWDNLGRTFAEFFHLEEIFRSDRVSLEQPERFEALRGKGAFVACSLHMGNWEIVSQAALLVGLRPAGVYQSLTNPLVDRRINQMRAPLYPGGLWSKSPRTAMKLLHYVREGGCVAFLADQREGRGILAPFFGRPAPSTPFPAVIARSVGVPVYLARVKRLAGVRFSIGMEEIEVPHTPDRNADVAATTRLIQAAFEQMVREAPQQWLWAHRRWD
jgi:Kdo2-lipid IVA lauroyltransferase/acyltransferase